MIAAFVVGQIVVAAGVAFCLWLLWAEWRERLREREERRLLNFTVRTLGAAWEDVVLGSLDIDGFCMAARRAHLAILEGRESSRESAGVS